MRYLHLFTIFLFTSIIINAQVPVITSIVPANGPIGISTTLNGSNFSSITANNVVYFGAVKAVVTAATSTTLSMTVPIGTTYKPVTVLTNNLIGASKNPFIITNATGGQNFTTSSFANAIAVGGGSSIIEGDFDLDGKIDVASTRFTNDLVIVGRNTSSSSTVSFSNTSFFGAVNPIAVKAADINNDGLLDLVVANPTFSIVYVFKNISTVGTINFATPISFGTGAEPRKLTIADIDNDGKIDIISSNQSGNSISILRNTNAGPNITFAAKIDFATAATPEGLSVGDLDNDGKIDILITCSGSSAVSVFKNISTVGNITMNSRLDYTTGGFPWEVVTADIDNDGKLDIITSNTGPNTLSVIRNTTVANLSFANKIDFGTSFSPRGLVVNDLDTDGKLDLITVNNSSTSEACVLKNTSATGNINFNTYVSYPVGGGAIGVTVADFNLDGLADIMTANSVNNNGSLSFLRNQLPINTGIPSCSQLLFPLNNALNVAHGLPILMKWRKENNATGYLVKITPTIGAPITVNTIDTTYNFTPSAGNVYTWSSTPLNLPSNNTCASFTFTTCNIIINNTIISVPSGNTNKCVGDSILIQASSSSNIQWYYNDQIINGATANFLWAKQMGNYNIRISNSGCFSDPSNTITINNLATPNKPSLLANGPTTFCSNNTVTLSSSITNATNQWYKNDITIIGANASNYNVNSSGNYYIKITDASSGCPNYSDTMTITVNTLPATPIVSIATGTATFCQNQSVKMASSASIGNQWFKDNIAIFNAAGLEYMANAGGAYTVKTTQNGCTTVASNIINITVNALPNAPIISVAYGTIDFCAGDSVVLSSNSNVNNKWFKNGIEITGAINPTYKVIGSGLYTTTTTVNGCESASSSQINATAYPFPTKPSIQILENTLTANSGYASYKWFLNNVLISGSTTNQINATKGGNYKVEVTENNTSNCKNTSDILNFILTVVNNVTIDGNTIKVYPNPVKENLNIDVTGSTTANTSITLTVVNIVGQKITTVSLNQGYNKVNVLNFASGLYQLIIQKGNIRKVIKILKL